MWRLVPRVSHAVCFGIAGSTTWAASEGLSKKNRTTLPFVISESAAHDYRAIICGGGTAGCATAYFLARWLAAAGLQGDVLLIERGPDHTPADGPSPVMVRMYLVV
jgi:hypothetical protein